MIKNNKILILIFWLIVWQITYISINNDLVFVSPKMVFINLFEYSMEKKYWVCIFFSLLRITIGILFGFIFGIFLSFLGYGFKIFHDFFSPALMVIKATPVASFIILALVIFKTFNIPIFITFLMVMPICYFNIYEGLSSADKDLLEVTYIFKFTFWEKLKYYIFPSIAPFIRAALYTSIGLGWKAGIAAEVLSTQKYSIGGNIYSAKIYLDTTGLFTWTITVILLSFLFEGGIKKIFSR